MITNTNSIVQLAIQIKYVLTTLVNENVKIIVSAKKISCTPNTCICENRKYLKVITDASVIECDKTLINTIATNVTSTASINCQSRRVKDYYILTQFY